LQTAVSPISHNVISNEKQTREPSRT
jgi:hypothetical protein